jgi:hypothetical protein
MLNFSGQAWDQYTVVDIFFRPQQEARVAEIAPVVPDCRRCHTPMQIDGIHAHPRFLRVEIVSFQCECGLKEQRVAPHKLYYST